MVNACLRESIQLGAKCFTNTFSSFLFLYQNICCGTVLCLLLTTYNHMEIFIYRPFLSRDRIIWDCYKCCIYSSNYVKGSWYTFQGGNCQNCFCLPSEKGRGYSCSRNWIPPLARFVTITLWSEVRSSYHSQEHFRTVFMFEPVHTKLRPV